MISLKVKSHSAWPRHMIELDLVDFLATPMNAAPPGAECGAAWTRMRRRMEPNAAPPGAESGDESGLDEDAWKSTRRRLGKCLPE